MAAWPDVAEPGKGFCFHWADGRAVCAFRKKEDAQRWLDADPGGRDVVHAWYGEPVYGKTRFRVANRLTKGALRPALSEVFVAYPFPSAGQSSPDEVLPHSHLVECADPFPVFEQTVQVASSLGRERRRMPQIEGKDIPVFVRWLRRQGVDTTREKVPADTLKPTQRHLDDQKAAGFSTAPKAVLDQPLLVSREGRILDGHHRWLYLKNEGEDVNVLRCGARIDRLIELAHKFPSSFRKKLRESLLFR